MFKRPHAPKTETVNDLDGYVSNFWRAVQSDPESVADWTDWPVNELDLHARHRWLVDRKAGFTEQLRADPDFYDSKVAGWWVWGICQWIGSGWCAEGKASRKRPHLGNAGKGVHRPSEQRPHLGNAGTGVHRPDNTRALIQIFARRLRNVRVCCGDWERVCGPSATHKHGLTGVFLDPPYTTGANRDMNLYVEDSGDVGHAVTEWAIKQGDNPKMRIAVCGYEGEYEYPDSWECVAWKTTGGYGSQSSQHDNENAKRERIWFSPHCLKPSVKRSLFESAI